MNEDEAEAVAALLNPLLRALEALAFIARHLHPQDFQQLLASVGTPDADLKTAQATQPEWPALPWSALDTQPKVSPPRGSSFTPCGNYQRTGLPP